MILSNNGYNAYDVKKEEEEKKGRGSIRMENSDDID
jgi:hypothetical protein